MNSQDDTAIRGDKAWDDFPSIDVQTEAFWRYQLRLMRSYSISSTYTSRNASVSQQVTIHARNCHNGTLA